MRTALTLWRNAATDAPLRTLALTIVGCALFAAPALGGAAAIRLFPHWTGPPASWVALSLFSHRTS